MEGRLLQIFREASSSMKRWAMFENGDRVLVGLSGGKDSLALVEVLAERQKIWVPRIEVTACHVAVEGQGVMYESDEEYLRCFCEERGVRFIARRVTLEDDRKEGRSKCWLCSWSRRKELFRVAEEEGFGKLALGHHIDDIAETLLMNAIYTGRLESMPPVLKMDNFALTVIRPFCEIRESSLKELASERGYREQVRKCPFEDKSKRQRMKELVAELREMNPDVTESLFSGLYYKGNGQG